MARRRSGRDREPGGPRTGHLRGTHPPLRRLPLPAPLFLDLGGASQTHRRRLPGAADRLLHLFARILRGPVAHGAEGDTRPRGRSRGSRDLRRRLRGQRGLVRPGPGGLTLHPPPPACRLRCPRGAELARRDDGRAPAVPRLLHETDGVARRGATARLPRLRSMARRRWGGGHPGPVPGRLHHRARLDVTRLVLLFRLPRTPEPRDQCQGAADFHSHQPVAPDRLGDCNRAGWDCAQLLAPEVPRDLALLDRGVRRACGSPSSTPADRAMS